MFNFNVSDAIHLMSTTPFRLILIGIGAVAFALFLFQIIPLRRFLRLFIWLIMAALVPEMFAFFTKMFVHYR